MSEATPVIEARGICKYFGAVTALENVSLRLMPGEVLGVVGDNGAGKSTLMKTLSGLQPPSKGELLVNGQTVHFNSPKDARDRGIEMVYDRFLRREIPVPGKDFCDMAGDYARDPADFSIVNVMLPRRYWPAWSVVGSSQHSTTRVKLRPSKTTGCRCSSHAVTPRSTSTSKWPSPCAPLAA